MLRLLIGMNRRSRNGYASFHVNDPCMNVFFFLAAVRKDLLDLWPVLLNFKAARKKSSLGRQEFPIAEMRKSRQKRTGVRATRLVIAQRALLNVPLSPMSSRMGTSAQALRE